MRTPAAEYGGRLSPDQRWLACHSNVSGQWELQVTPFSATPSGRDPTTATGRRHTLAAV
jgi:hypothetical protein